MCPPLFVCWAPVASIADVEWLNHTALKFFSLKYQISGDNYSRRLLILDRYILFQLSFPQNINTCGGSSGFDVDVSGAIESTAPFTLKRITTLMN